MNQDVKQKSESSPMDDGSVPQMSELQLALNQGEELDLKRKLHQESVVKRIRQIKRDGKSAAPWVVELDPTSACNLACPDCISKDLLNQGGFERARLKDLAQEMVDAGVRAVIMIGGGEPMAHPESGTIIETFAKNGLHVGVTTNGTLIDRHLNCLADHTSWVRVSVDAATPETFQHFRPSPTGVSKFDHVINNMALLAKHKRGRLGYSFLMLSETDENGETVRSNFDEIYQGAELAREIGCDYFEVKPSYDFDHFLIDQSVDHLAEAKRQIAALPELATDDFRIITPVTLEYVLNNQPLVQPKEYKSCPVSELRTLFTPSGAYVCPYFRGLPSKKIGDPVKQSFTEIWQGAERQKAMAKLDPSKDCSFHCIRHRSNEMLFDMLEEGEIETIEDYNLFI